MRVKTVAEGATFSLVKYPRRLLKSHNRVGDLIIKPFTMGFLQLIPATQLAAMYDSDNHRLVVYAAGNAIGATTSIHFQRNTAFVGGLSYSLMGWVGPLTGKQQPYICKQAFAMSLPDPHFDSGFVNIITAGNPNGQKIPIYYLGIVTGNLKLKKAPAATAKLLSGGDIITSATPGHTPLNVLYKTQFAIRASANVPTGGKVDIQFDDQYVQLKDALIENGDIVWTFFAAEMGNTQIVVTTYGGIATYVMVHTYDVRIFVL